MISVIIPVYNAKKTIGKCLKTLMKQDYAGEYEVIVVDDGSTDSTPQILSKFNKAKFIRQDKAGPAAARNRGAAEAKGEIILFTDADCIPESNWITEMIKPFKSNSDIIGVRGRYKTKQKEITARFVQCEYEDKYNYMLKENYIDFMDTYSAGFKKEVFLEMKGYDIEFPVACAEDIELSYRLSNKGYKMVYNPDAIVYHIHPNKLIPYLKKKYKFAYWRILALKKNPNKVVKDSHTPQLMKFQLLFPPIILGASLLSFLSKAFLCPFLSLLGLFVVTSIPFMFRAFKKEPLIAILSPLFLFFRACAQFLGVVGGLIYILKAKKEEV